MAKMQKVWLRVVATTGDTTEDVDYYPDRVLATGKAYLKPNVNSAYREKQEGPDGYTELNLPSAISATIVDGYLTYNGKPYIWLEVSDSGWNWNIAFMDVRIRDEARQIEAFNFDLEEATPTQIANASLPDNDPAYYRGVNLADKMQFTDPATGSPTVQGERGYTFIDVDLDGTGNSLVFTLGDPTHSQFTVGPVPALSNASASAAAAATSAANAATSEGNALAYKNAANTSAANAATSEGNALSYKNQAQAAVANFTISVDHTDTLAPGSPAVVTVTPLGGGAYSLVFQIPKGDPGPTGPPAPDADATTKGILMLAGALTGSAANPALAANSVDSTQIKTDAVTAIKILAGAVSTAKLADGAVTTIKIGDKQVTAAKIADDTITAAQIAADAVGASELADNAVDTNAIAALAVTLGKLAANSVDSSKIVDGTIVDGDISATAGITASKTKVPASFFFVSHGSTRANGTGDLSTGVPIMEPMIIDEAIYWFDTPDGASQSTTVKLQYQRAGTTADIVGTSKTVATADQTNTSASDANRRTGALTDATRSLQAGDRLLMNITSAAATPGKVMGVYIKSRWL